MKNNITVSNKTTFSEETLTKDVKYIYLANYRHNYKNYIMTNIKSILLINNSDIDNFINHKILELNGLSNLISFKSAETALGFLITTNIKFQFIIVELYLPIMSGFQFIDKFNELGLNKTK